MSNQWQLCPKCQGQKTVSRPPYLPADVQQWSATQTSWPCDICNGMGLLPPPSTPPATEEAELWKEIGSKFLENLAEVQFHTEQKNPEARKATIANFLNALQEIYHLCLRSEQNSEAIEFTEWANERYTWVSKDKWDGDNDDTHTTAELYQEFQLFKQKQ